MGGKYEILYWDWIAGEYISEGYTNSFFKAMRMVRKLERTWSCVTIKFRRDRVRHNVNTESWIHITTTDFEE